MSSSPPVPLPPSAPVTAAEAPVNAVFGPLLIGVCFNCIFYGIFVLQAVTYYVSYRKDAAWLKLFILYLFFVESVNVGCNIATIYEPLILRYGTAAAVTFFPRMIASTPITGASISAPVQIFTAWRIVVITGNKWIGMGIVLLSLTSLAFAINTAVVIASIRLFAKKVDALVLATVWLTADICADLLITISLYVSLNRRRTGSKSTDAIIDRVIRLAVQTGLMTVIFALAETTIFLVVPNTTANFAFNFPLSKLYSNALLSTLNARLKLRQLGETQVREVADDNLLFQKRENAGQSSEPSGLRFRVSTLTNSTSSRHLPRPELGTTISLGDYELHSRDDSSLPTSHVRKEINTDSSASGIDKGTYQPRNLHTQ